MKISNTVIHITGRIFKRLSTDVLTEFRSVGEKTRVHDAYVEMPLSLLHKSRMIKVIILIDYSMKYINRRYIILKKITGGRNG